MSKCASLAAELNLMRVYSVFFFLFFLAFNSASFSYPLSKNSSTFEIEKDSDLVRMTRSARETSKPSQTIKSALSPMAPGSHNVALSLGQIFLSGNLSSRYENAIGTQIHYTYGVSDMFGFEANIGYSSHSSGNLSLFHTTAGLRANLVYFDQLVPFFSGGLGFYKPSLTFADTNVSVSSLLFGLHLGTGADLILNDRFYFGARLTFHDMFDSSKRDSNGTNREIGGSFISFLIHAGMSF